MKQRIEIVEQHFLDVSDGAPTWIDSSTPEVKRLTLEQVQALFDAYEERSRLWLAARADLAELKSEYRKDGNAAKILQFLVKEKILDWDAIGKKCIEWTEFAEQFWDFGEKL